MSDPFGTAALRAAVLEAWAASPTRFREDANAEEDLRLGGYADAWCVELAQNAADAARTAGVPGRMRVAVHEGELRVANTGAPLDAAGVAALASLRASAKRDDTGSAGRFGVGFSAVLALSDAPRVVSRTGGVAFSASATADAVAHLPGPAAELARRGVPPVLRLVWPTDETTDLDTEVRLPLRPGLDPAALLARARADAPGLLLALPALVEIEVGGEVVRREDHDGAVVLDGRRWTVVRSAGELDADTAGAQAVEQRGRRGWAVTWALPPEPLDGDVLHAPTPTEERLSLPARLIATVPLEPDRRRARPGPVTERVLDEAAAAYVDLVHAVPDAERAALVPQPGFPRSEIDGALRDRIVAALRTDPWLPGGLAPDRAEWLDLPGAEHTALPGLLAGAGFGALVTGPVPAVLRMRPLAPSALVERLFGVERPPHWWRAMYGALAELVDTVPGLRDDLRALPVPLADGRTAAGPPTVLVAASAPPVTLPGLHVAHPDAVHPLLLRLGATEAGTGVLLEHPALLAAVDGSMDDADAGLDPLPLARAVLALVAGHGRAPDGLGALALPAADGRPARADELLLPDAALLPLLAPDAGLAVLDAAFAAEVSRDALVAVGVLDSFAVVVDEDPPGPDHDLDDELTWWADLPTPPKRVVAVRDLDLVADDAWPAALELLAARRETREALVEPDSYTGWWLARNARLRGALPRQWRLPSAAAIAALYDACPVDADEAVLEAAGVRPDLAVADAEDAADLLARLADAERRPDVALVAEAHVALTEAVADGRVNPADLDPPEHVRALDGTVVGVDVAVVLDEPWPASVLPPGELVAGGDPDVLADLLDLPLATDVVAGTVEAPGEQVAWTDVAEVVVACHTLGVEVPPGTLTRHAELRVAVTRPVTGTFRVPAWPDGSGGWHAEDPLRALLALLAGPEPAGPTC